MLSATAAKIRSMPDLQAIVYNDKTVDNVSKFKYLGVILDRSLTFDDHVAYLRHKIFPRLKTLGRIRQYISQKLAVQLYKRLILPDFDYADPVYDAMSATNAQQLQVLQNSCLRICTNSQSRTPSEQLYQDTNILAVRRKMHSCDLVFKGTKTYHLLESMICSNPLIALILSLQGRLVMVT